MMVGSGSTLRPRLALRPSEAARALAHMAAHRAAQRARNTPSAIQAVPAGTSLAASVPAVAAVAQQPPTSSSSGVAAVPTASVSAAAVVAATSVPSSGQTHGTGYAGALPNVTAAAPRTSVTQGGAIGGALLCSFLVSPKRFHRRPYCSILSKRKRLGIIGRPRPLQISTFRLTE